MSTSPMDNAEREMPAVRAADERAVLTAMLEWYREGVLLKVDGMAQDLATTSPVRSGTTVAGVVKHLAATEDSWFTHRLAERGRPEPWADAPFDRDPDWVFRSANEQPLADSVHLYTAACRRSRAVADAFELSHAVVDEHGRTVTLRWVLVHLLEETARHLGHLDLLRELADGRTGE